MLAEPVIVGFTFAAAILIGMSQIKFLFLIDIEGEELILNFISLLSNIDRVHFNSFLLSFCCILLLLVHKFGASLSSKLKWFKFVPFALIVVIIATSISAAIGDDSGWDIIGDDVYSLALSLCFAWSAYYT